MELPFAMAKGLLNYALRITNYALKVSPINNNTPLIIIHHSPFVNPFFVILHKIPFIIAKILQNVKIL